jgi:hypothetical protein
VKFQSLQRAFAAHIRNPAANPAPADVEDRRMRIYRDLFFNNMQSLLAGTFPVLHEILGPEGWKRLVRDFYSGHHSHTLLFPEVAREFLRYLRDERDAAEDDPPFLCELAHYEWVELSLEIDDRSIDDAAVDPDGDPVEQSPVLSPLVRVLSFRFPVHLLGPDYQPAEAPGGDHHYIVYRNRADEVKFMAINEVSLALIAGLQRNEGLTGRAILEGIATSMAHPEPEKIVAAGAALLEDFRRRDILLGTRR